MNDLVSIIIPAYNVEKYVEKCINSVVNQTYERLEIIVINDGSTDNTKKILEQKAKKDKRIKIISQHNRGLSAARNTGIKSAKGEYIAFIDGDDIIEPNFIESNILNIKQHKSDISVCGFTTITASNKKTGCNYEKTINGTNATIQLLTRQENVDIIACNKLYKKNLFVGNNIFYPENEIHEDTLTTYKLYSKAEKVSYIKPPLYNYYKRSGSITTSTKLAKSLGYKLRAAEEAKRYFSDSKSLSDAAEIAELLAYYSLIDAMLAKKIPYEEEYFKWIKDNKKSLSQNQFLTKKLKIYLLMTGTKRSFFYRIFRKITL